MHTCPLCEGEGKLPDRQIHFGDGAYEAQICSFCRGTGAVNAAPFEADKLTIVKFHGVWGECAQKNPGA